MSRALACCLACGLCMSLLPIGRVLHAGVALEKNVAPPAQVLPDPSEEMRTAIADVLDCLKKNAALYQSNPPRLREIVAEVALPHIQIERMARLALGKYWPTVTAQQQAAYVTEFRSYLVRSYTNTLYIYRNTSPKIVSRSDSGPNKSTLKLNVKNERGATVVLFLRLENRGEGWKIIDINAEGISLVVTARGLFDNEISKVGFERFLSDMREQNRRAAAHE